MNTTEILLVVNSILLALILAKERHSVRLLQRLITLKIDKLSPVGYDGLPMNPRNAIKPGGIPVVVVATLSEEQRANAEEISRQKNELPMSHTELSNLTD